MFSHSFYDYLIITIIRFKITMTRNNKINMILATITQLDH
jgi:hypothetical protein